jgi:hypothetical protein
VYNPIIPYLLYARVAPRNHLIGAARTIVIDLKFARVASAWFDSLRLLLE